MKNFTQIPNELLEKSELSTTERYLFCILLRYCGQKDYCYPSQKTLAKDLGIGDRQVRNLLKRLESLGLIRSKRNGWNRSNTYEVTRFLSIDRNSSSYLIRNKLPFQHGNEVPTKKTYQTRQDKKSRKGLESLRESLKQRQIIK